jgi:endonuclease/exonuclease/phosphatase (EEP) superfamily protein YafD
MSAGRKNGTPIQGHRRVLLAGAGLMASGLALLVGGLAWRVPSEAPLGALMRLLDPLAPWILALGAMLALATLMLGARRSGTVLMIVAAGFAAELWLSHRALSLPVLPDARSDLRVLFFNALAENTASADRIVDATLAAAPDVAIFAEAGAVLPALERLRADYTFVSPCTPEACEILVIARRRPERFWTLTLNPIWEARYAVLEVETESGARLFVAASHLVKPWFSGVAEDERAQLSAQYRWFQGPVVAMGDFNATPWSRPMRTLLAETGMRTLRRPVATWPAAAGRFGLPIDHVLVGGGARVVRSVSFGADLGSNHLGLLAEIAVDPDQG